MKLRIILRLALKHLRTKKLRSIVTIGGMAVGIGVIVFLLSFGFGLQNIVTEQLVSLKSIDTIEVTSQKSKVLALDSENVNFLKSISGVKEVVGLYNIAGKLSFGSSTSDVVVYGTSSRYLELSDVKTSFGQTLSKDYDGKNLEGLVNVTALEAIGLKEKGEAVGKDVSIKVKVKKASTDLQAATSSASLESTQTEERTINVKVVGVVDDSAGSFIYLHEEELRKLGQTSFAQVLVLAEDRSRIPSIREQIENRGFTPSSPLDTLNQINQVFRIFNLFLAGLGTFGLAIAAGGMFNTLTVSLLERTREIGLMKILGARKKDVLRLFLAEALIMTFIGGLLGLLGAFLLGIGINVWINFIASQRGAEAVSIFKIPFTFGLFIVVFSIVLGFITAIYPALRGTRIDPLQALKHE
jgi:putative ABC transport system permease protein